MTPHPAAALFPMMGQDDLEALAADIQAHGLMVPIVLHNGMVLDGRNRFAACELAEVDPVFVAWGGEGDPTSWVVSQNLHRRHLTESQRAMVAATLRSVISDWRCSAAKRAANASATDPIGRWRVNASSDLRGS